jgi:hypothetical protein
MQAGTDRIAVDRQLTHLGGVVPLELHRVVRTIPLADGQ